MIALGIKSIDRLYDVDRGKYECMTDEIYRFVMYGPLTHRQRIVFGYIYEKTIMFRGNNPPFIRTKIKTMSEKLLMDRSNLLKTIKSMLKKGWLRSAEDMDHYHLMAINFSRFANGLIVTDHKEYVDKLNSHGDKSWMGVDNYDPLRLNQPNAWVDSTYLLGQDDPNDGLDQPKWMPEPPDYIKELDSFSTPFSVPLDSNTLGSHGEENSRTAQEDEYEILKHPFPEIPGEDGRERSTRKDRWYTECERVRDKKKAAALGVKK